MVLAEEKDLARAGSESDDTEGLIDHIRAIEPVVVACVFEELNAGVDTYQSSVQE